MDLERTRLLRQAGSYFSLRENGAEPPFPQELTVTLLSSQEPDNWRGGLHLVSQLGREEIRGRFFENRPTYSALAVFLAAGVAAYRTAQFQDRAWSTDDTMTYLRERWVAPHELVELTLEEYDLLDRLLFSVRPDSQTRPAPPGSRLAVLVHGSWGAKETWWRPNVGGLWQHVHAFWPHLYAGPAPFAWSGKNHHAARVTAALRLVTWARAAGADSLDVIAHSHGGNVCLLAARIGLRIDRLILLGTPIRTEYLPHLGTIASLANVFSVADSVQTPLGTFPHRRAEGRTLGDSPSVSNWRAEDDGAGSDPGHSELHEPSTWVASRLDDLLA